MKNRFSKNNMLDFFKGFKILEVTDNYLIGVRGYVFYKYDINRKSWNYYSKISGSKYSLFANFNLLSRLLRIEVTKLYSFDKENIFCIAKKGIYRYNKNTGFFEESFHIKRGSRPLNLCQDRKGTIYFGEYFSNMKKTPISIYKSINNGRSWEVAHTFKKGEINHIHGVFQDLYSEKLWFLTGDRDNECIIGYTENGFKSLNIVFRGGQEYRSCILLFYKDYIVFATDSQYIKNSIKLFDRNTYSIRELQKIQGSCIYGAQCGNVSMISTTVEPSKINKDKSSYLWVSLNGKKWRQVIKFDKDLFASSLFQFASIRFPNYNLVDNKCTKIFFSGRSLKQIGGSTASVVI